MTTVVIKFKNIPKAIVKFDVPTKTLISIDQNLPTVDLDSLDKRSFFGNRDFRHYTYEGIVDFLMTMVMDENRVDRESYTGGYRYDQWLEELRYTHGLRDDWFWTVDVVEL